MSVIVSVDMERVRQNAEAILRETKTPIIAVVKCNAYGLGAAKVAEAIGDLVEAFYVFDAAEAVEGRLWEIAGKRTVALHTPWNDPQEHLSRHIQPVVWSMERATALRSARPVLSIDTGQQRFCCPAQDAAAVRSAGDCREVMTHAVNVEQVERLLSTVSSWDADSLFLHAAGSALLKEPTCWLNAVRPGMALYRGAVRVSARLVEVKDSKGPAGYTGFEVSRFGVILAGYSRGLRKGPCSINGQIRRIIEVGMQSAFVEVGPTDQRGDEVILLGQDAGIDEVAVSKEWKTSPQEVLVRMANMAGLKY